MITVMGCQDSDQTTVSIASVLVPDGLVDLILINGSTSFIKNDQGHSDSFYHDDGLKLPPGVLKQSTSQEISDSRKKRSSLILPQGVLTRSSGYYIGNLPKAVYLKTTIWYDQSLLQKFRGSHCKTKSWILRVVQLTKTRLAHPSLKVRINLIIEDIKESTLTLKATSSNLNMLSRQYKKDNIDGLNSYFCYELGGGIVGYAWLDSACLKDGYAVNINEYYTDTNPELSTARIYAHELGHNIGMR